MRIILVFARYPLYVFLAIQIRIAYEWTEDYVIKYMWSAAGYGLIAVPLLFTRTKRSLGIQTGENPSESEPDNAVARRTESMANLSPGDFTR